MIPADKTTILMEICTALLQGERDRADALARSQYPFESIAAEGRHYTELQSTRVFVRDGFIDRYSGQRLVFPGTLRLLSTLLPEAFPYQSNWKISETHMMYWELFPAIDHVIPVTRGGKDSEDNWVTASQIRNSAKAHWTLAELNWTLLPPGDFSAWDGLMTIFVELVRINDQLRKEPYLMRWYQAAVACLPAK